jgi:hypothetical protein
MMKNPAANIRSGKLLASVRLQVRRNHFNGSPIFTLLEGYCRESIKRPIGTTALMPACRDRRVTGGLQAVFNYQALVGDADQSHANPIEVARLHCVLA